MTRAGRLSLVFPFVLVMPIFTDDYELFFYTFLFFGLLCVASLWFSGMMALFLFPVSIPIYLLINYLSTNNYELYKDFSNLFERYVKVFEKFLDKFFYWLPKEGGYFE